MALLLQHIFFAESSKKMYRVILKFNQKKNYLKMHKFPVFFLNSWIVEKIGNAFFILFSLVWLSQIDSKFDGVILFFVQYTMCMKWIGRCTFFPFAHSI